MCFLGVIIKGSSIPFLATLMTAKRFGENPRQVLAEFQSKYGDVFTLNLIVLTITFIVGPEGHRFFFAAKEDSLSFMEVTSQSEPKPKPKLKSPLNRRWLVTLSRLLEGLRFTLTIINQRSMMALLRSVGLYNKIDSS